MQLLLVDGPHAGIDSCGVQLGEHEDLRGGVDTGGDRGDMAHAVGSFQLGAPLAKPFPLWMRVENLSRTVVQPVLP